MKIYDVDPSEVFKTVAMLPEKRIKVTAHLEDEDGDVLTVSEVSKNLSQFVFEKMKEQEQNTINTQLFPLAADITINVLPRFLGINNSAALLSNNDFREAVVLLSLSSFLFNQYISKNKLKIVSEIEDLTEQEIEDYKNRSNQMADLFNK